MEYLANFGLFLAQAITIVIAIGIVLMLIMGMKQKNSQAKGQIQITDLSEQYDNTIKMMQSILMNPAEQKAWEKKLKQEEKEKRKTQKQQVKSKKNKEKQLVNEGGVTEQASAIPSTKSVNEEVNSLSASVENETSHTENDNISLQKSSQTSVFVIDFDGGMDAQEVRGLREEITAILSVATSQDQVVVRLTSPGGVVHGYGLAASQLTRIKNAQIPLIAVVDKVAASGGYMMACVADKIVAAPFAIIGSIGVVAQVPNFHRLLKKNEIDVELHTAGAFKRTLTLFGENTEEGREKFRQELNETHDLFKRFVSEQRPSLDIESVATGEHWYGSTAKEKGLIDEISTSDDYLQSLFKTHKVLNVKYVIKRSVTERVTKSASQTLIGTVMSIWQNNQRPQI